MLRESDSFSHLSLVAGLGNVDCWQTFILQLICHRSLLLHTIEPQKKKKKTECLEPSNPCFYSKKSYLQDKIKLIKNVQLLWNVHDGHSTDCLAKLFQCLTTHFEELFFPMCNWNFSCCNLFPLCLLLCAPVKCVCFCSQPSIRTQKNATKSLL